MNAFIEKMPCREEQRRSGTSYTSPWPGRKPNPSRQKAQRPGLFDRINHKTIWIIILIAILSVVDAFLSIELVGRGAQEINPIMSYYLNHSPLLFFGTKYLVTCASILIILLHKNFHLFRTRLKAGSLLVLILLPLLLVVQWELYLIFFHP